MTSIVELDPYECNRLLRENEFGRVAFVSRDHPVILPVNYMVHDGLIVFRTDPGEKLTEIPMRSVAFEIHATGDDGSWSVLAQGFARNVTTALGETYDELRELSIPVEAPGEKSHWIAIEITQLSGRRIS